MSKIYTTHYKLILDSKDCDIWYNFLVKNINWIEGVKSKKGFTRLAAPLFVGENIIVDTIISMVLSKIKMEKKIYGIYLNYYKNGEMWTPNHSHPGSIQLVISLGEKRILTVANKKYNMKNGDAIIFGSSIHEIPKMETNKGRISIACFLEK